MKVYINWRKKCLGVLFMLAAIVLAAGVFSSTWEEFIATVIAIGSGVLFVILIGLGLWYILD